MDARPDVMTLTLERALRWAAVWHKDQVRKGSGVPYVQHAMGVALILDRLGFPEEVVVAGLLHDVVEDTDATLEQVLEAFGPDVAEIVGHCSEVKADAQGRRRPWIDRKRDHLDGLRTAPVEARAVVLADKLHNLLSIELDLQEGRAVWSAFNADRAQVLWYYRTSIDQHGAGDSRLDALARHAREALARVEAIGGGDAPTAPEKMGGRAAFPVDPGGSTSL